MRNTVITCDLCGKEITHDIRVVKIKLEYNVSYSTGETFEEHKRYEVCHKCKGKIITSFIDAKESE